MADALQIRTALDKEFRPLRGDFLQTIMIELTPGRGLNSLPLNLGILLDVSNSMHDRSKLENAKKACILLLNQLSPQDRAAVCVFSSGARTVVRSQMFSDQAKQDASRAISALRVEGATEIMAGLNQVYAEVAPFRSPEVTTFVIMLSDGEPTDAQGYADTDLDRFLTRVDAEFKTNGVSLSTIGLGSASDYDAGFLRDLGDRGAGKFLLAQDPNALADAFQDEFGRIQSTVLSDVTIEVNRLNGTVRRFWRVVPDKKIFDPPRVVNGGFRVPVGSIQNDQPQAYLLDVVTGAPAENIGRGMLCQVAAIAASGGTEHRSEQNVLISYSDNDLELVQRNQEVVKLMEEAVDFKLQMDLEQAVKTGDKRKMTSVLERKKKMTQRLGKTTATKVLDDMQDTLDAGGDITPDALAVSSVESKKTKRLG
ncbi:MAG: VWA domain-containing protein [Abitibacteriaceae bacterium]|nr:VWA domain-containing protein [Abditibacteriaceae bacterium]